MLKTLSTKIARLIKDESGQAIAEYTLLLGVTGTLAVSVAALGDDIKLVFENLSGILQQLSQNLEEARASLSQSLPQ